jgi:hypothetical protein
MLEQVVSEGYAGDCRWKQLLHQNPNDGNVCLPLLMLETFEKARRVAPGWDVYFLEGEWREWIAKKGQPEKPGEAFIAFCRKKYQRKGMSR